MLVVEGLDAGYGEAQILFGVDLTVNEGEVVTLLGRNGMGKTTTVRSIMGITRPRSGSIRFERKPLHQLPSYRIAQAGLGLVPEGRQVFPNLTVRENLVATARPGEWTLERVYDLFGHLKARQNNFGNQLSGGEQQMLAIGRAIPMMERTVVVFPMPLRPSRVTTSPLSIRRSTPNRTWLDP